MRARRIMGAGVAALMAALVLAPPAVAATSEELVGDALAQAFTLRASADQGGASLLHFYFGSYADAYLTTPPPAADGQASWYNFGIAETALFKPPEECTPEKNAKRIPEAVRFMRDWLSGQARGELVDTLRGRHVPAVPIPSLPCGGGRPPGFAQSRSPETDRIRSQAADDLLVSGVCRGEEACAEPLRAATGGVIQGGSFEASATDAPSQSSDAFVIGLGLGPVLHMGSARSTASTVADGDGLVTATATWTVANLCLMPTESGCGLEIDHIRQVARVVRSADGSVKERSASTVIAGVSGPTGQDEVTADQLGPGAPPIELGGFEGCNGCTVQVAFVPSTGGCGDPSSEFVADTGGIRLLARGDDRVALPVPIVGAAAGGGLMLGGVCASGRMSSVSFDVPDIPLPGVGSSPGSTIGIPPIPGGPGVPPSVIGPQLSPPRTVEHENVRFVLRSALAWRTAPYWGTVLAALVLLSGLGFVFRTSPVVAPVVRSLDRFARQFVRG